MHLDIPDCRRCCLCVPLRHGILIFGYLNLIFTVLVLSLEVRMYYSESITTHTYTLYRGVAIFAQIWLPYLLFVLDIIFNVVLLVGAHTKQTRLIRVYYYYGIMTTVATCLTFILVYHYENQYHGFFVDLLELSLVFSAFVIQVYLLLLIRTELQKLKYQQGQFSYVNHMSEVLEPPNISDGINPL